VTVSPHRGWPRRPLVVALTVAIALGATACDGSSASNRTSPPPSGSSAISSTAPPATVVATTKLSPRERDLTVNSPAVGGPVKVRLILPASFSKQPTKRWPVLYLLHGCCDTYLSWTRSTDIEQLVAKLDVLVVMPDGGRVGFYSDWLSGHPGWETFHLVELRRILEDQYRAGDARAIVGVSMGGLGALDYTARHPGMFRAAASFSGIVHTRLSPEESSAYEGLVQAERSDPAQLWGDPVSNADVWAAHNPYDLAPKLAGVPLFLSVGDGRLGPLDPPGQEGGRTEQALNPENVAFAAHLKQLGISAHTDFYGPGTHNWTYWQRELHRAWPMLSHALGLS
jgi:diacylglycerol O-acyltransferase / trehalose O-mycolyltransferase